MSNPRKVPRHIPAFEFFKRLSLMAKLTVIKLVVLTAGAGIWAALAANNPTRWAIDLTEVTNAELQEVVFKEATQNYRTLSMTAGAYTETATYAAGPIEPPQWLVLIFPFVLATGLAFFLAGLTKVKTFSAAIGYGAVTFLFLLHGMATPDHWAVPVILFSTLALASLLAFLFHQEWLKWSLPMRGLAFFAVLAAGIATGIYTGGWKALHAMEASMFPGIAIMLIGYILLNGRELINVILLAGTNAANPKWRLPFPVLLACCLMLLGLELLMLQDLFGWGLLPNLRDFPFRPIHLLTLTAIVTVITSQNAWIKIKESVSNPAYTLGLAGLSLAMVAGAAFYTSLGDYGFLRMTERLIISVSFFTGVFYLFYVIFNFRNSIGHKDNYYYLIMMPKRLLYVFVMVAVIFGTLILEASDGFKVKRFLLNSIAVLHADREMVKGELSEALVDYKVAQAYLPGDVKANYNQACLHLMVNQDEVSAQAAFDKSSAAFDFPLGALNKANLEMAQGHPWEARHTLQEMASRHFTVEIGNNLAISWVAENNPDSAIYWLKQAIVAAPERSTPAANLGLIYLSYNRPVEARKFLDAAARAADAGPVTFTNASFYNLAVADSIPLDTTWLSKSSFYQEQVPQLNMALWLMKHGDLARARTLCDTLLAAGETPDVMLLDGMLKFESGQFDLGYSRIQYLANFFPDFAPRAWHYLGFAFFQRGVPEMAAAYFHKAADAGLVEDAFLDACMEIDAGNHDYAFTQLIAVRALSEKLIAPVSREIAMLQLARGFNLEASMEWDMADITQMERIRISRYAGHAGNIIAALENFRVMIEADPKTIVPYLEMGRIRLEQNDSLAIQDLEEGLKKAPDHYELNRELARALIQFGQREKGKSILTRITKGHEKDADLQLCYAQVALQERDTATAQRLLKQVIDADPLHSRAIRMAAQIYLDQKMDFEGQVFITAAITLNNRNAAFYYYLACFEQGLHRPEEAALAARKAMELQRDDIAANRRIEEQFKAELSATPTL